MNRQGAKIAKAEPDSRVDALAHAVIGAAIEVHRHLAPDSLESIYEEAMAVEFSLRDLLFERQKPIAVDYKDKVVASAKPELTSLWVARSLSS